MKTTHELYKYALAVLLALAGGANVWGQRTGNQYTDAGSGGDYVSVEILNATGTSEANNHEVDYAIDKGNYSSSTYWQSTNNDENPTITLQIPEGNTITRLEITSAPYSENNRPRSVTIRTSNSATGNWTLEKERNWNGNTSMTIDGLSIREPYVQIEFERNSSWMDGELRG